MMTSPFERPSVKNVADVILKLQRSLFTTGSKRQLLTYNEDRSFTRSEDYPEELDLIFGAEDKIFVRADIKEKADDIDIHITELLPDQGW